MKASMVAMSGAIMPEPLAMPLRVTVTPPRRALRVAALGKVSVVMMARAASAQASALRPAKRDGKALTMGAGLSGSPMTPVEAWKISLGRHLAWPATALASAVTVFTPALPVKALALPELTMRARALPPLSFSAHQSTGAERDFELVRTPATEVPGARIDRKSVV